MLHTELYRSGHNEAVLKTVCLHGHQGSNPCGSATKSEVTPISWTDVTIYGGTFMLITRETKLEIVKKHLEDGVTLKELSEQYGITNTF